MQRQVLRPGEIRFVRSRHGDQRGRQTNLHPEHELGLALGEVSVGEDFGDASADAAARRRSSHVATDAPR